MYDTYNTIIAETNSTGTGLIESASYLVYVYLTLMLLCCLGACYYIPKYAPTDRSVVPA